MDNVLTMNTVLWIAQIALAAVFLYAGFSKILPHQRSAEVLPTQPGFHYVGLPDELASAIALLEIAFAVILVMPIDLWPPYMLSRLAAAGLALLAIVATLYHMRRHETAAPSITLFLLALFVIVGRWP